MECLTLLEAVRREQIQDGINNINILVVDIITQCVEFQGDGLCQYVSQCVNLIEKRKKSIFFEKNYRRCFE